MKETLLLERHLAFIGDGKGRILEIEAVIKLLWTERQQSPNIIMVGKGRKTELTAACITGKGRKTELGYLDNGIGKNWLLESYVSYETGTPNYIKIRELDLVTTNVWFLRKETSEELDVVVKTFYIELEKVEKAVLSSLEQARKELKKFQS